MNTIVRVTGYGMVTPLGNTIELFDAQLFAGQSAVEAYRLELAGLQPMWLPLAKSAFDAQAVRAPSNIPMDRGTAMALSAAHAATTHAALQAEPERLGVFWGSGMAGAQTFEGTCQALYGEQRRMRPTTVPTTMPNAAAAELALAFKARGAAITYACACASSAVAIGEAVRAIRAGWIDVAIAGGHEAMLAPAVMASWHAMRVLAPLETPADAPHACRPFSTDRSGFALGEGAAALVLESAAHARLRGADTTLFLAGYANNCDGIHITNPDPAGQIRAMKAALKDADIEPTDVGYINAHGTATLAGDAAEAQSIAAIFGGATAVSSSKAIHGHLMGAGGAVEMVSVLRALERRQIPPTAHTQTIDPSWTLDVARGQARPAPALRYALSNSFAFGGTNATLIAGRDD